MVSYDCFMLTEEKCLSSLTQYLAFNSCFGWDVLCKSAQKMFQGAQYIFQRPNTSAQLPSHHQTLHKWFNLNVCWHLVVRLQSLVLPSLPLLSLFGKTMWILQYTFHDHSQNINIINLLNVEPSIYAAKTTILLVKLCKSSMFLCFRRGGQCSGARHMSCGGSARSRRRRRSDVGTTLRGILMKTGQNLWRITSF